MARSKPRRRFVVYVGLFAFVVVGLVLTALPTSRHFSWPTLFGVSTGSLSSSIGQGLVVAALLGAFVDYRLKRELAEDISEETAKRTATVFFNDLLGGGARGLPDAYYQGMRALAATDILALEMSSVVEFRKDATDSLHMRISHTLTLVNVSSGVAPARKPWILAIGVDSVVFERYDLEISRRPYREGELPLVTQVHLEADVLNRLTLDRHWSVSLALPVDDDERFRIPPQATASSHFVGSFGCLWEGLLPIVASCPTLSQSLTLKGDGLDELDVWVQIGRDNDVKPAMTTEGRRYDLGFGVQGTTARLLWKRAGNAAT